MGRRRRSNHFLPKLVYLKGKCYWYAGTTPWTNLGSDIDAMFDQYAQLERLAPRQDATATTFGELSAQYRVREMKNLAPRTQYDYARYLDGEKKLLAVFGHMRLQDITPRWVTKYHALRGEASGEVQANREKACLSAIWNWGRRVGLTDLANPCAGVKRHTESRREVYVDHATYHKVWQEADWDVRDVLDLAWLTAQRPADVFKMRWRDVAGGEVAVRQGKTGMPVRVQIGPELAIVLCDMRLRNGDQGPLARITPSAFDNRFEDVRRAAGVDLDLFQLRDLRAKAGTEKTDAAGIREAQALLGHTTQKTTEIYVRGRRGKRVRSVE